MQSLHQIESVKALPNNPAEHQEKNVTMIKQFSAREKIYIINKGNTRKL